MAESRGVASSAAVREFIVGRRATTPEELVARFGESAPAVAVALFMQGHVARSGARGRWAYHPLMGSERVAPEGPTGRRGAKHLEEPWVCPIPGCLDDDGEQWSHTWPPSVGRHRAAHKRRGEWPAAYEEDSE